MFRKKIESTPFTASAVDAYFQNITGRDFMGDVSFLATLRALIAPRIKEDEAINLQFGASGYNSGTVESISSVRLISAICQSYDLYARGQIFIHNLTSDAESNLANIEVLRREFEVRYEGYHRLEKITEFYRKSFVVDCYIDPDLKNVIIFADNLDYRKMHYLQVSILAFLPWYVNQEEGVTEDEMALIKSLREKEPDEYERCLLKIAEKYDFRTETIRRLLTGFESKYEVLECNKVRIAIENIDSEINELNCEIGVKLRQRNENCIRLMGLERKIEDGSGSDSEIMEYFLCNKKLSLEEVTNTNMVFTVKDYLEYFDRDMAEQIINRDTSFVYRQNGHVRSSVSSEKMKKLMTEIFVNEEPRLRIKTCATYRFDLNGSVGAVGYRSYGSEYNDCIPNPHIHSYQCMGNYSVTINNLLKNRDYIGAIEQCIASCKSLNWGDSTVMENFMSSMWGDGSNNRCIELPDGRVVAPGDAFNWLEEQEEQEALDKLNESTIEDFVDEETEEA